MVAKFTDSSVSFAIGSASPTGRNAPHMIYANLDFQSPTLRKDARQLLKWLDLAVPYEWESDYDCTLLYLEKHQEEFRDCLDWINKGFEVDFSSQFEMEDESTEFESRAKWEHHAPLKFFRRHTLHRGVTFEPEWQEFSRLSGLRLTQQKPWDPLDPICWHVLFLLVSWGTIFVRRCPYWKCGKFFYPPTKRRLYCSDSCRALRHAGHGLLEDDEEEEARRKKNREYMRKYRGIPSVKRKAK